jgi:hypothetical protein
MRKLFIVLFMVFPVLLNAQIEKTLKKTIELKMPKKASDALSGTRGTAVAWNPEQKKYYAAFAGNAEFPFAVFDASGKRRSSDDLSCTQDVRGLWYNPGLNKICGNSYYDIGWFSYKLDTRGLPVGSEISISGLNQPGDNSIGVYNEASNRVYFLDGESVFVYNADAIPEEDSTIRLYPGVIKSADIDIDNEGLVISEDYSINVLIYTGIKKAEFGLLNIKEKRVELYDRNTGLMTQKLKLPANVKTYGAFNFSYTNATYWAFDQDTRTWTGYK